MKTTPSLSFKSAACMIASVILCYLSRPVTSSSYLSVLDYSCGSSTGVGISSFNVDCDQCTFGSSVAVAVDVYFSQGQTEQANATVWFSKSYIPFFTLFTDKEINICDVVESTGDAECPATGSYEISTNIDIPEYNWYVTGFQGHMKLNDSSGDMMLNCTVTFSGGYQMHYDIAAAACAAGFCVFFLQRKWKNGRVVSVTEDHGNFEMMKDSPLVDEHANCSSKSVIV
eukprot:CAMPEP_0172480190 /NCGR_PEP_ID=MMETSP1066-20121228/5228_1 /TAXON_ID=671091 /ORGANISM="Coscinodiscus wailesii, Strain CCMP2513" /LENGTH=227 /DNA_ID=CAMNT_0013241311 /DNA_START=109 /DNA_END=792 /DNA_ORIENTATION=-